jgi:predicted metal-dependent HD superfamily phosphohydrolase
VIDFDLKMLAKGLEENQIYAKPMRKECNVYPDFFCNLKKKARTFHRNEILYQTETFRILFEANAIPNMHQEINGL